MMKQKEKQRKEIEKQTAEFLKKGGKIQFIEKGKMTESIDKGSK